MISGEYFDKLDFMAKFFRGNSLPFGGIQLLVFGDFLQLPPVSGKFVFTSDSWKNANFECVELVANFRQINDERFQLILKELRYGKFSDAANHILCSLDRDVPSVSEDNITKLFSTRSDVEEINALRLSLLVGNLNLFPSEVFSSYSLWDSAGDTENLDKHTLAEKSLKLKENCRVMLIKNLKQDLVNGMIGKVVGFEGASILVLFDGSVQPTSIFKEQFIVSSRNKKDAVRLQFPLILSYALTIHKSQGMTLDYVSIDLIKTFQDGQAYVAISRCTSLNGLQIKNFDRAKITANQEVVDFYKSLTHS